MASEQWPSRSAISRKLAPWPSTGPDRASGPADPVRRGRRAGGHYQEGAGPLAEPLPAPLRYQHLLEGVEVLDAFARAEDARLQRTVGQVARHPGLFAQPLIEAAQQGTTASERDTAVHNVAGQLGRAHVERGLDDVHDGADGPLDRVPDLLGANHDGRREAGDQGAAGDLGPRFF